MATLSTLIKLRSLMNQLSAKEHYQFVMEMSGVLPAFRNFIINSIFDEITRTKSIEAISHMNHIIWPILKSRTPMHRSNPHLALDAFEPSLLLQLCSFLQQTDINDFSTVNRSTFIKCNHYNPTSVLHKLIQFRTMMDQATHCQFKQFIFRLVTQQITRVVFNALHHTQNNKTPHQMNAIILRIMRCRNILHTPEPKQTQLQLLPNDIIGEIATYLAQRDYFRFCCTNRLWFVICNLPNKLQQMDFISNRNTYHKTIQFNTFPCLKRITMHDTTTTITTTIRVECIVTHLLYVECQSVREMSFNFVKCLITTLSTKLKQRDTLNIYKSRMKHIVEAVLNELSHALRVATNKSSIDNHNESFPDDLKMYTERAPKLDKYWSILSMLLELFPKQTKTKLINTKYWKLCVDILIALEDSAATYMWAKNDDKLLLMQIMIRLIEVYAVDAHVLYDDKLITMLTSHFLVSTRSKYVSQHMEQTVMVTFRLLRHFARCDEKHEWIRLYLVNSYWFLWSLTDIVTPHHVFGNSNAAHCIIQFVATIIDLECIKRARHVMIKKVCAKWLSYDNVSKIKHHPRDTVLKLLMTMIKTEADHRVFLEQCNCNKLMKQWIENYFFTDILDGNPEQLVVYHVALDFFEWHVDAVMSCDLMIKVTRWYMMAICALFSFYFDDYKENIEWKHLFAKALKCLRGMFDMQQNNDKMVCNFLNCLSVSELMMFPWRLEDYNVAAHAEDKHMKILQRIISTKDVKTQLKAKGCPQWLSNGCQISRLFEIYISLNLDIKGVHWTDIMLSCWFVRRYVKVSSDSTLGMVLFCVLMSTGGLHKDVWFNPLLIHLTKAVLDSIQEEQHKSQIVYELQVNTICRYLPIRLEMCVDFVFDCLLQCECQGSDIDDVSSLIQRECSGFIQYFWTVLDENQCVIQCILKSNGDNGCSHIWWAQVAAKIHRIIEYFDDVNAIKTNLVLYLGRIKSMIDNM
eukprot:1156238_1